MVRKQTRGEKERVKEALKVAEKARIKAENRLESAGTTREMVNVPDITVLSRTKERRRKRVLRTRKAKAEAQEKVALHRQHRRVQPTGRIPCVGTSGTVRLARKEKIAHFLTTRGNLVSKETKVRARAKVKEKVKEKERKADAEAVQEAKAVKPMEKIRIGVTGTTGASPPE